MPGLAILLAFHFLGLLIQKWTSLPIPANVIGLILFTACLFLKIVKLEWVEPAAQFLLKHMMLFFVPLVVGTVVYWPLIQQSAFAMIFGLLFSTLISLAVTGWFAQWLEGKKRA
jgi:holin-like protein